MDVTEVRVTMTQPRDDDDRQRAIASVILDNCFAVHGLRVMEGQHGHFVSMPSRKGTDGKYYDVAHPITAEASQEIRGAVLVEYDRLLRERQEQPEPDQAAANGRPAPRKDRSGPER